jgi:transcriptional regulator with XRE-family HTH domain
MEKLNSEIGLRIRGIREGLGMNQAELGKLLNVGKASISKYENGDMKRGVPPGFLVKIAELGGVSLDELITGHERAAKPVQLDDRELLRQILTSDPSLLAQIQEDLKIQVREELAKYGSRGDPSTDELLAAYEKLTVDDQLQLIKTAKGWAAMNESRRNVGGGSDCADQKSA